MDETPMKTSTFQTLAAGALLLAGLAGPGVARAHITLVVGRGANEGGCIPETFQFGELLKRKGIPHHLALWGEDSSHTYPWWQKQARHYLSQMF